MRPLQIGLLVIAGALGGAVFMKYTQRARLQPELTAEVAQQAPLEAPAPIAQAPAAPEPAPPPVVEEKPKPSEPEPVQPVRTRKEAPKPQRVPKTRPRPVQVSQYEPPLEPPVAPIAPTVQPEPVREAPAPASVPPARSEPEIAAPAPPPQPLPEPHRVTLTAGMLIPVRLVDGLSSERNMPGDTFTATLDKELVVDGFVIGERGARVDGRVVASDRGGKVRGTAGLSVELTRLRTSDGQTIPISTDAFERQSENSHRDDAAKIGAGAAVGAIIGAIAGGGKGAAIGAGVGGGAGAGDVLLTRGKPATLPSETKVSFRLRSPVTITEKL